LSSHSPKVELFAFNLELPSRRGLGLFASLAPRGIGATIIAAWFLAAFFGNFLSGFVSQWWVILGATRFFVLLAGLAGVAALGLSRGRAVREGSVLRAKRMGHAGDVA